MTFGSKTLEIQTRRPGEPPPEIPKGWMRIGQLHEPNVSVYVDEFFFMPVPNQENE